MTAATEHFERLQQALGDGVDRAERLRKYNQHLTRHPPTNPCYVMNKTG
jgi:hypothetical protein